MTIAQSLLPEFDREMEGVKKSLERAPEAKFGWRPHAKSRSLGELVTHLATLPGAAGRVLENDSFDPAAGGKPPSPPPQLKTRKEVLETFEKNRDTARDTLAAASDEHLRKPWTFSFRGKELFTLPREQALRRVFFSHMIHHRAQLGVYLRLNDVAVPSLYGPSADEQV